MVTFIHVIRQRAKSNRKFIYLTSGSLTFPITAPPDLLLHSSVYKNRLFCFNVAIRQAVISRQAIAACPTAEKMNKLPGFLKFAAVALLWPVLLAGVAFAATGGSGDSSDPYAVEPAAMTVAECGRCHPGQFRSLKTDGGRHRIDCQECHRIFHAYNPQRGNYAAIMPQCTTCHQLMHGEKFAGCLGCHDNPHAPLRLAGMQKLAEACGDCHSTTAAQLAQFPSAHSGQKCATCHSERHGRIPECTECHTPHFDQQTAVACQHCHPAHKPLQISLAADTDPKNCATCHADVFTTWTGTRSAHGKVNCTVCHDRHGRIPECIDCHRAPHDPKMLARFKSCLGCHIDPHNLPSG